MSIEITEVSFQSEGSRIEGNLYLPSGGAADGPLPSIVLAHGYTGTRELILPDYAERFAEAGFAALTFDYRGWGTSEGTKWRMIPLEQIDDIRNALTYLQTREEVDPERIGVWGTSFGGANAPYAGAVDQRFKAVVSQIGFGDGEVLVDQHRSPEERSQLREKLGEERRKRVLGEDEDQIRVEDILRGRQSLEFLPKAREAVPAMDSYLNYENIERVLEYKPIDIVHKIAPRPVLFLGGVHDDICTVDGLEKFHAAAQEPKELVLLDMEHYAFYEGEGLEESSRLAIEFFKKHL